MWIWLGVATGILAPALFFLFEYQIERRQEIVLFPRQWRVNLDQQSGTRYVPGEVGFGGLACFAIAYVALALEVAFAIADGKLFK